MARINWLDQALDDLDAICDFIARDAPRYAQDSQIEYLNQLKD